MSKQSPPQAEANGEVRKLSSNTERLESLFSKSRDLTLNAKTNTRAQSNKRAQKSYAPNLNVARNKNTEKSSEPDGTQKNNKGERGGRGPRGGKGGRNNNNNSRNNNLIQTVGFLSEGIAATPVNRRTNDHYGGSSKDSVAEVLQKPRLVKRELKPEKADLDAEAKMISDLLGEGSEEELDLDDDSKTSSSDDFLPIKIKDPSKSSVGLNSKKLKTDAKIKLEPVDDDVVMASPEDPLVNGAEIKIEPEFEVKSEAFHRMDTLFEATPNEFALFQLPDTLPGRAPELMDTSESTKTSEPNLCTLEHLDDGLIGKIVRYQSGKTKLVLGDTVFDVDLGLTSDFQQNAVTVNANTSERSANMYSLGPINAKYNVTPDWIHLFHKMDP